MDVRVPGFEAAAKITKVAEGHYKLEMKREDARLDRDFDGSRPAGARPRRRGRLRRGSC